MGRGYETRTHLKVAEDCSMGLVNVRENADKIDGLKQIIDETIDMSVYCASSNMIMNWLISFR